MADGEANGETWDYSNSGNLDPSMWPPFSGGHFAIVDSRYYGAGKIQDTSLESPVINLSGITSPVIGFGNSMTYWDEGTGEPTDPQVMSLQLSLDGGKAWTTVFKEGSDPTYPVLGTSQGQILWPIPQGAGQSDVRVRFTFAGSYNGWWAISNVFVGTRSCGPLPGGLVAGQVTDANTGHPVNGATITDAAGPSALSAATGDPTLPGGFYSLFAPAGTQQLTASGGGYTTASAAVNVTAGGVTRQDWALQAGRLAITPGSASATQTLGQSGTATVTLRDDGTDAAQVTLAATSTGFTPTGGQPGAQALAREVPVRRVRAHVTAAALTRAALPAAAPQSGARPRPAAGGTGWSYITDYEGSATIVDNAVATDPLTGDVYSVGGYFNRGGYTSAVFVYGPSAQAWSPIASLPQLLKRPAAGFIGGKLYVAGGWTAAGISSAGYVYDPSSGTWSQIASLPGQQGTGVGGGAAAAVLGGQLYVIGGALDTNGFQESQAVYRYDPASNTWTPLADYPVPVDFAGCAGIAGEIVCAGGLTASGQDEIASTYVYNPASNTWAQAASMPYADWGMASAGANGELQVMGGVVATSAEFTNQVSQYDPASNTWAALPNLILPEYRGGGGCGLYQVGGQSPFMGGTYPGSPIAQVLPGYGQCPGAITVPWLSESGTSFDLAPGQSQTVTLSIDSAKVAQPGTYRADLAVETGTPYLVRPIAVTLHVNPPRTWGEITGTVTSAKTGRPIAGVTVQVGTHGGTGAASFTTVTGSSGAYQWWLDTAGNPLQVIAAEDSYVQQVKSTRIKAGAATTLNFALQQAPSGSAWQQRLVHDRG